MSREIAHGMDIAASPGTVWSVLTDFPAMGSWNPFITRISGPLREGAALSVLIAPPGKMGMRFSPVVLLVEPNRELRWKGKLLVRGLLDGEHWFRLERLDGRTRFIQGEIFSGLLVPLFGQGLLDATLAGFERMNRALKDEAERREAAGAAGTPPG